jgi:hypothetical protein
MYSTTVSEPIINDSNCGRLSESFNKPSLLVYYLTKLDPNSYPWTGPLALLEVGRLSTDKYTLRVIVARSLLYPTLPGLIRPYIALSFGEQSDI